KCLERPRADSRTSPRGSALTSAIICPRKGVAPPPRKGGGAAALARRRHHRGNVYEVGMWLAWQTLAPTAEHSAEADTNWSLITVSAMFDPVTHFGVRSEAGCELPWAPLGGVVLPLTSPDGGVMPARS